MGQIDYSKYFDGEDSGPISKPASQLDFRPRKASYNSYTSVSQYLRNKTKEKQQRADLSMQTLILETPSHYQQSTISADPYASLMQSSAETYESALLEHINFQPIFWFVLASLIFAPLVKSTAINVIGITSNIKNHFDLSQNRGKLVQEKEDLAAKLSEYHSYSGMKRTIKEEIKVIEKNEILIKLTK